jgi:serine protease inhibitor
MRRFILTGLFASCVAAAVNVAINAQAKGSVAQTASTQSELGFRLLEELANGKPSPDSVLVSPASLAAALAFLDLGADKKMHAAITKSLGFGRGTAETPLEVLRQSAGDLTAGDPGKGPLVFADAVFVDPAGKVRPEALDRFKSAGMEAREARLGTMAGVDAVNAWVSKATAGLIPGMLDKPIPDPVLVLLNALHFKDDWAEPFSPKATAMLPFHLVGGGNANVAMMRQAATFAVRQDERFIAVSLPYKTTDFSLTVITAKGDPAKLADFAPAVGWLTASEFTEGARVSLSLPKLAVTQSADLIQPMNKLGLATGYSKTAFASLSEKPIDISGILQKTLITVDETGTEAAASTAIVMLKSARPSLTIAFDKPFLFALLDKRHGFVLMEGYIGNPAAK